MNGHSEAQILIVDAGAQYGKVINRRVEEMGIRSVFLPMDTSLEGLRQYTGLKGVIISGGPGIGAGDAATKLRDSVFALDLPVLGICYGAQIIGALYGAEISSSVVREDGQFNISIDATSPLFDGMRSEQTVLITHGYGITTKTDQLKVIAKSDSFVQGVQHATLPIYGLQFHPEVDLTPHGRVMMKNFCHNICGISLSGVMKNRQAQCIEEIQSVVKDRKVLALLSGGVDSTVLAALLTKALGPERVLAIHIDNGLMRKNESKLVIKSLADIGLNVKFINASYRFLNGRTWLKVAGCRNPQLSECLNHVTDPEHKRRIIGDTFMHITTDILAELEKEQYILSQGTLAPDLIESGSKLSSSFAATIKTHHNDSPLAREFRNAGKIVEPLKTFHKDEVRALGTELGLPDAIVNRHPFPGPGLSPRILCQLDPWMCDDFSELTNKLNLICSYHSLKTLQTQMLNTLEGQLSDAHRTFLCSLADHPKIYPVLLPIRSVGVQGDERTYSYAAGFTQEKGTKVPWQILIQLTRIVTMLCNKINRCCYVFGDKIEYQMRDITPTLLTPGNVDKLREADDAAMGVLSKTNSMSCISQMPVVLIPIHFDRENRHDPSIKHSVVLRPFVTNDFMTGVAGIPGQHIPESVVEDMASAVSAVMGVSRVLYDLTSKPPGTTEWE